MSVSGPGPGGPSKSSFMKLPGITQDAKMATDDQRRASEAEREANRRINQAYEQSKEAELAARIQVENTQDSFERQYNAMSANNEAALEQQKIKGYEAIRDLQRMQQAELRRLRREGEKDLVGLQEYYRGATYGTESKGKQELSELQGMNNRRIDYERSNANMEFEQVKGANTIQVQHLRDEHEQQVNTLKEGSRRHYEQVRDATHEADLQAEAKFKENFSSHIQDQRQTLANMQSKAKEKLDDIREDTSAKLSAYSSRQRDPFYKIMDMDAALRDRGDHYLLTATIPEHEQEHVSVSVKGNNILLSTRRSNEETQQLEHGHSRATSSFQAFHESFPLKWPIEPRNVTKEFHGDKLVVIIPKKNEYAFEEPERVKPEKIRLEAPHFPDNLKATQKKQKSEPPAPLKKTPGSGTLS